MCVSLDLHDVPYTEWTDQILSSMPDEEQLQVGLPRIYRFSSEEECTAFLESDSYQLSLRENAERHQQSWNLLRSLLP